MHPRSIELGRPSGYEHIQGEKQWQPTSCLRGPPTKESGLPPFRDRSPLSVAEILALCEPALARDLTFELETACREASARHSADRRAGAQRDK